MSGAATRILLARRTSRRDHTVVFEPGVFRVEGVPCLPRRRIAYRSVYGVERAGVTLWIGAGFVPAGLGGRDVPPAQLAAAEAELRARIAALPDGARRLARLDARRAARVHPPWLTVALAAVLGLAFASASDGKLGLATELLFLLSLGFLAEPWLGPLRLLASGAAALIAGGWVEPAATVAGLAALAARLLPASWIGLVAFTRLLRERGLSVRERSGFDLAAPLALGFVVEAFASGASLLPLGLAALAGFAIAPLVLRRAST